VIDPPAELERIGQRHREHAIARADPALTLGLRREEMDLMAEGAMKSSD
jgi:hypothetical protein